MVESPAWNRGAEGSSPSCLILAPVAELAYAAGLDPVLLEVRVLPGVFMPNSVMAAHKVLNLIAKVRIFLGQYCVCSITVMYTAVTRRN